MLPMCFFMINFVKLSFVPSQKHQRHDASSGFYQFDASLSSSCIKSVGFIKLNEVCENQTRCHVKLREPLSNLIKYNTTETPKIDNMINFHICVSTIL